VRRGPAPHFLILLCLGIVVGTTVEVRCPRLMIGFPSRGSELPREDRQTIAREIWESRVNRHNGLFKLDLYSMCQKRGENTVQTVTAQNLRTLSILKPPYKPKRSVILAS
jgi:hypothetical protein